MEEPVQQLRRSGRSAEVVGLELRGVGAVRLEPVEVVEAECRVVRLDPDGLRQGLSVDEVLLAEPRVVMPPDQL